jgi:hypothetical protein
MCRKLLCLIALLGMVSVASAALPPGTVTPIDDFESYWGAPAMVSPLGPWGTNGAAGSSGTIGLGGTPMAGAWMDWSWTVGSGWADPANPTNYDSVGGNSGAYMDIAPYDITEKTRIHMSLKVPAGMEQPYGEYLIEYNGDAWAQTWIPSWQSGAQWFIKVEQVPAYCWDDAWGYDPYHPGNNDYEAAGVPRLDVGGDWLEIVIDPTTMYVTWGAALVDIDALDNIGVVAFSDQRPADSSGASGDFKMDGTNVVWPKGPHSSQLLIDNIWFEEIPEPMTIGLLGLGALALIRRKR